MFFFYFTTFVGDGVTVVVVVTDLKIWKKSSISKRKTKTKYKFAQAIRNLIHTQVCFLFQKCLEIKLNFQYPKIKAASFIVINGTC